jgi:hypothetical protein
MGTFKKEDRALLPFQFGVKPVDHPLWKDYMEYINSIGNNSWGGDATHLWYGLNGMNAEAWHQSETSSVKLMTFDDVLIKLGITYEEPMVITYDGETHPISLCVQIHCDAINSEEWALRSECTRLSLDDGWALDEEVLTTLTGETFLECNQDYHQIVYSEHEGEYLSNDEDVFYGYVNRRTEDYFVGNGDEIYIDDTYYLNEDVARQHDYSYSDRQSEWVHCDNWEQGFHDYEEDEDAADNAGYHDLTRKVKFDSSAKFTVGFEVEKEDGDCASISYRDVYDKTGWIKERDGSLDDSIGYELVSPAFNLYDDMLDQDIKGSRNLQDLINGRKSSSCGGHINIGSSIYNTEQLFEGISGFLPLFYSMYEGRLDKTYSKAKKKHEYYRKDKYSSVYIKDNVVELRIPSAVINVENLLWRRDLIRIIIDNFNKSEVQVLRMLLNDKSKLHLHLRKVYSLEKLLDKIDKFVQYSDEYNNKKLKPANKSRLENKKSNEARLESTLPLAC